MAKAGEKRKPITFSGSGRGAGEGPGGKKRQQQELYMDRVGGGRAGRSGYSASNYRPGKTVRPSGHYAPPGGKFSSKLARRSTWSKE